mmetsp:Transcript_16580/g.34849  ORF Transcript_16580/g.34849 Transcript_16580/m.34849 type:complete len:93 (+) Transcript_16580:53-331(+)
MAHLHRRGRTIYDDVSNTLFWRRSTIILLCLLLTKSFAFDTKNVLNYTPVIKRSPGSVATISTNNPVCAQSHGIVDDIESKAVVVLGSNGGT